MKRHFERYFELFPMLVIILILVANEHRHSNAQTIGFEPNVFSVGVQAPRLIFR